MATARAVRGVTESFLQTYTSRYSSFDGYWLFGFVVSELTDLRIDLLSPLAETRKTPLQVVIGSAKALFVDQLGKAGVSLEQLQTAELNIHREDPAIEFPVWMLHYSGVQTGSRIGHRLQFTIRAVTKSGVAFFRQRSVNVAPHDPSREQRCFMQHQHNPVRYRWNT